MPPKRSAIWLHFTDIDGSKAKCDLCKEVFSHHGGGTTNLKRHLNRKHPTVLQKQPNRRVLEDAPTLATGSSVVASLIPGTTQDLTITDPENQPLPSNSGHDGSIFNRGQQTLTHYITRPASITKQKRLNNALLKFIIKDFQPFSIVNDEGFKHFCKTIDPTYQLPSRTMLTNSLLPQHYDTCLKNVESFLNQASSVAITTDTWTSISNESYMAITAHLIDNKWEMGSVLLNCLDVSSSRHTAEYLKEKLLECFVSYGIDRKISGLVSDNAANISAAVKLTKYEHIRCIAHSLNLIVQDGVREIADIQKKVKCIVEHFHRSTIVNEKLKVLQKQMTGTESPLKLINDVVTRWNSTFHMFERFCQLQEPIGATLAVLHLNQLEMLTPSELLDLNEICLILRPFDGLTSELSAENNVTISKILVIIEGVKQYLGNLTVTSPKANSLARVVKTKVLERFQHAQQNYLLQCSTYLDPRFKDKIFYESTSKQVKERITKLVSDLIQRETQKQSTSINIPEEEIRQESDSFWNFFDSRNPIQTNNSPTALAIIELRQYSEENIIPRKDDPLKWWQSRSLIYPHLAVLAKAILAIPASSVSSERIFSKTGLILTERRNRIKPKNLQKIVFLNANFKYYD